MSFKIGDKVKINAGWFREHEIVTIINDVTQYYTVDVEFIDNTRAIYLVSSLAPVVANCNTSSSLGNGVNYGLIDGTVTEPITPHKPPQCECGAHAVSSSRHSSWCPISVTEASA